MSSPAAAATLGRRQPFLQDLITCVSAPTVALSAADGQLRGIGAQGVFSADVRILGRALLTVDGAEPEAIAAAPAGAETAEFVAVLRGPQDATPDPERWLRRRRVVRADGMDEYLVVDNAGSRPVDIVLTVTLATDFLDMEHVKQGRAGLPIVPALRRGDLLFAGGGIAATVSAAGATITVEAGEARLRWALAVPARGSAQLQWGITVVDADAVVVAADPAGGFRQPTLTADDRRLPAFVHRSVADLRALRMATTATPTDEFLAAGSPWYLTLFGRDSIWAARMLLPLGTDLAVGTLRTLAARQGAVDDPNAAEEPGKILHEIRRPPADGEQSFLPPVYYGTVDATPLWVCLLADAWRWGLPAAAVRELLPAAERALEWMVTSGDSDGDGFLEYIDRSGRGLANQGWKDSGDAVRFADGRVAVGPVALAEVQGYAYEAAMAGAALFDALGYPGAARWRSWAATLRERFAESFWTADDLGSYPVLALDGEKAGVDAPASNMGHLLGTGILYAEHAKAVADRLVHPSMFSGFGVRTMAATAGGYSPLSYHCGSVWPHDTAIAMLGLARSGFAAQATIVAQGLLAAGAAFDGRLPELFGGFAAADVPVPVPYPASCRPQAWSAASAVALLQTVLGLAVDVPGKLVTVAPAAGHGAVRVTGLRVAGEPLSVAVDAHGAVLSASTPAPVMISHPSAAD